MEAKPYPETVIEENGQHENHKINDHGWQTVTYPKRQRKSQPSKQSTDRDPVKSRLDSDRDRSSVFRSLEQHAEERIRLRSVHESEKAAAEAAARSKPSPAAAAASDDNGGDSDVEEAGDAGNKTEAKKPKQKKPKKPKISVAEAAARIDASDLSAFLIDISASYEDKQDIQLMRFADYFARAFSFVSASQFPWTKTMKESSVAKISDMPLSYISEPVYKTSVEWISRRSTEALGEFFLWSLDGILADLASQQSIAKSSKKSVQHVPSKAQVAMFVVLAMVLRQKPDVLISQLPKLRDDPKYQGQDKLPVYVWVICQACVGDLVVGMYSWVRNLLPVVSGKSCNPHSRDLVLQLVERILAAPKAKPILFNGVVRKGERLVPPTSLELLIQVTFPPPSSRIKATERFEAVYSTLKELSLAGSPGTKAIRQVSQQLLPITVKAMTANNPELSKEAASIFIWCLSQNTDCYKHWEKLHMENIEASVTVLQMLAGQWKELQIKLTHDNMKVTLKNLRQKNEQALAGGTNVDHETSFRDADKYCEIILGRLTRRSGCMKSGIIVLTLTIAAGAILMAPNMESWDWKNLHLMFSSSVLNIK
ncbi:hypothetical protein MRB53_001530 [Persea americana]|uniref:Uncharacterized protein n=1 Tax=Persea americana TaxID=3435 RepID=A0ACC2MRW0_PERAE|nr:hypothetical protein MRB53_001530 [Persea americana]